ncbi:MAG: sensor histidine kinase, partial [Deinococcota bacterium]|nr:sensor histidine kinase [Deinococcota bacterium]
ALQARGEGLVAGSAQRLAQVVRNLVRNAVQASGDPAKVSLKLLSREDEVVLEVCDEGPGIAAADLPYVFDRFFSRQGGTGLGLGIAKSLVESHGGRIRVFSEAGRGCCFTVTLPSLDASLEEDGEAAAGGRPREERPYALAEETGAGWASPSSSASRETQR